MRGSFLGSSQRQNLSRYANRIVVDPLSVIYKQGQWRINKATALHKLNYSAVKLKQYGLKIKQAIIANVASNTSTSYSVTVTSNSQLKYAENDPDSILISVSTTPTDNPNKTKVVYEAILLSWGVFKSVPDAIHLPYLIDRGEQKTGAVVKSTLSSLFDCTISQCCFTQHQLLQFAFNFVDTETTNMEKKIHFVYTTPNVSHKDKLTIHFEIGDVFMIWNGSKEETAKQSELVTLTYQTLQNQLFYMFELDITVLDLLEISMPNCSMKTNGTVKLKTPEMVNCCFEVLNSISLEGLKE